MRNAGLEEAQALRIWVSRKSHCMQANNNPTYPSSTSNIQTESQFPCTLTDHGIFYFSLILPHTLESPLDSKEIKPVNPKGNQPWLFTGRTDDEAEAPILWPPEANSWLTGKDPYARKYWRQEEKGMTDDMVDWPHWLNGHKFEHALGDDERRASLPCCSLRGRKELDMTEWLNNNPIPYSSLIPSICVYIIICTCRQWL